MNSKYEGMVSLAVNRENEDRGKFEFTTGQGHKVISDVEQETRHPQSDVIYSASIRGGWIMDPLPRVRECSIRS